MDVTPGIRKSKDETLYPSFSAQGRINPPKQASTWKPIPRFSAMAAISSIGSITPCGKVTAEAAIAIVRDETAFLIALTSAL
ncbi:uncharacterized protein METZ01_LOCUS343278 [marine metagenome]|uniref:Uncharacterized protein n=1 Tax=marine metagenome TaxID=408172 RepID=A0A382QY68_9ZZZZ